jgi:CheY-like chemotaxis protein
MIDMKHTVLLVEDDPNTQSMFQMVMDHYDIDLVIAEDEDAALNAFEEKRPDLVVMDIFLPNTDGYRVMNAMRSLTGIMPPVVATTAYYTSDTLEDIQDAGFDGYLLKPLDPNEIMPYLEQITNLG